MESDPKKMSDAEVIALAQAERDAGIPDQQTAAAAADAKLRTADRDGDSEVEAHPS